MPSTAAPVNPSGRFSRRAPRRTGHLGRAQLYLTLRPLDELAFYAGLSGVAAFGVVEWPIAVITGIGHALSDDRTIARSAPSGKPSRRRTAAPG